METYSCPRSQFRVNINVSIFKTIMRNKRKQNRIICVCDLLLVYVLCTIIFIMIFTTVVKGLVRMSLDFGYSAQTVRSLQIMDNLKQFY